MARKKLSETMLEKSIIFDALFTAVRRSQCRSDYDSAFYGMLSVSIVTDTLFGLGSPESCVIDSYVSPTVCLLSLALSIMGIHE